jgi:hypothetical protein
MNRLDGEDAMRPFGRVRGVDVHDAELVTAAVEAVASLQFGTAVLNVPARVPSSRTRAKANPKGTL